MAKIRTIRDLEGLRARKAKPLTQEQAALSDKLFKEYCERPQHKNRLTQHLLAALRAGANKVARSGPPPNYNQRLGYRRWKKTRKRNLAIAIYGDPMAEDTQTIIDRAEGREKIPWWKRLKDNEDVFPENDK